MFATAFTMGNLYDLTLDPEYGAAGGHLGFLKAVFALYLAFTALILFTYLIAMMSHRYEDEMPNAENAWRFDCVADVIRLEKRPFISVVFYAMHRLDYWLWCCCSPNNQQIYTPEDKGFEGRYFVATIKWRPWSNSQKHDPQL